MDSQQNGFAGFAFQAKRHLAQAIAGEPAQAEVSLTDGQYAFALRLGLSELLDRLAWEAISRSLRENDGKKSRAMERLKISTRALYSALKKYGGEDEA